MTRPCGEHCNRSTCKPTKCDGRIPWDELPCREFCNHYGRGSTCFVGKCGSPYRRDDPRYWLGRGSEDVPGKSLGWAHNMEREAIRAHLLARAMQDGAALYFRTSAIQLRVQRDYHRRKPPIGVCRFAPAVERPADFTAEELAYLVEMLADGNNPLARSIAKKARARLL